MRLSANRSARSSASERSVKVTAGTSREAQLPCRQHQTPARNDPPVGVDQDRQHEAEPIEARGELAHLLRRVLAGLPPQRLAARDRHQLGAKLRERA